MTARLVRWLVVWLGLCLVSQPAFAQSRGKRGQKKSKPAASAPAKRDTSSSVDDDLSGLDNSVDTTSEPARPAPKLETPEPPPPAPAEPATEEVAPSESEPVQAAAEPGSDETERTVDLRADVMVGGGLGTRSFQRPTGVGGQVMATQLFPAAEVGLQMRAWPEEAFSLYFLLRYQTSLGLVVQEQPLFALPNRVDVRSDRAELSCAPVFRLGSSPLSPRLAFPIGLTLRTFWPALHNLMTPRMTLWGPQLRVELHVPITTALSIRVGPELQWIAHFNSVLTDNAVQSMGIAVGAEASVRLALASVFALEISFRQSTAMASVDYGPTFRDVERYVTARLIGTM